MTALRSTTDRAARLPDERDGRHPVRPARDAAAARRDGRGRGPRRAARPHAGGRDEQRIEALISEHAERFEVDPALPRESHAYAARFELALRDLLEEKGYRAFSAHFDSVGGDGRFEQLPLLAASDLMADGYGYAAEGDTNTATLMCAAQTLIGDTHFCELYAMDFELDSVLVSHMGEGNWKIARRDRPVRLIDRELGIGGLGNPPTTVFSAEPGPATTAALVPLEGEAYRLIVGHGEVLDTPELPNVEMPYFHFRPQAGVREFMDGWLALGSPCHFAGINVDGEKLAPWWRLTGPAGCRIHRIARVLANRKAAVLRHRQAPPSAYLPAIPAPPFS